MRSPSPVARPESQDTDARNFCVQTVHNDIKEVGITEETMDKPKFRLGRTGKLIRR